MGSAIRRSGSRRSLRAGFPHDGGRRGVVTRRATFVCGSEWWEMRERRGATGGGRISSVGSPCHEIKTPELAFFRSGGATSSVVFSCGAAGAFDGSGSLIRWV